MSFVSREKGKTAMIKKTIPMIAILAMSLSPLVLTTPVFAQDAPKSNQFWWPDNLDLSPLRDHGVESSPMGDDFNYAAAFASVDLDALKKDIETVMKTSQD